MRSRYRALFNSLSRTSWTLFRLASRWELCQRPAVPCIQHGRFLTEIGELDVEIAGRSQQLAEPAQLIPQRVCPFRNQQGPGGAQDGTQLSRGHAHLVQAFRFPSEPGAWIMRKQPSDMM